MLGSCRVHELLKGLLQGFLEGLPFGVPGGREGLGIRDGAVYCKFAKQIIFVLTVQEGTTKLSSTYRNMVPR